MAQTIPCDFCQAEGENVAANFLVTTIGDPVPKSACLPCFAAWGRAAQDVVDAEYAKLEAEQAPTAADAEGSKEVEPSPTEPTSDPAEMPAEADQPVAVES